MGVTPVISDTVEGDYMRFAHLAKLTFHGAVFSLLAAHSYAQNSEVPPVTATSEQAANEGASNSAGAGGPRLIVLKSTNSSSMTVQQIGDAFGKGLTDECASLARPAGKEQFIVQFTDYLDPATGIYSTSATIGLTLFSAGGPLLFPRMTYLETRVLPSGATTEKRDALANEALRAGAAGLCKLAIRPLPFKPR
jgi:hypothetical protein